MAVPKRKTSKHRKRIRRAHHALGKPGMRPCSNCQTYGIPHRVCSKCGFYRGRIVVAPKIKKVRDSENG